MQSVHKLLGNVIDKLEGAVYAVKQTMVTSDDERSSQTLFEHTLHGGRVVHYYQRAN